MFRVTWNPNSIEVRILRVFIALVIGLLLLNINTTTNSNRLFNLTGMESFVLVLTAGAIAVIIVILSWTYVDYRKQKNPMLINPFQISRCTCLINFLEIIKNRIFPKKFLKRLSKS